MENNISIIEHFNIFLHAIQQEGKEITIDCEIENIPLPVITTYFKTTGKGEEAEENFNQHSRTVDDLIYQMFCVRLENGLTLNSVLFSPVPKKKS